MVIKQKSLNAGEKVLVSSRTHPKALLLPLLTLVVLLAVGVLVQVYVTDNGTALLVVWVVIALLVLWRVVWKFLDWLTSTYALTDQRLITRTGILTRRGHDIPIGRISDVSFEHDLIDRVLGCGTLVIHDASEQAGLRLNDIPGIEDFYRTVSTLVFSEHEGAGRDESV